LEINITTLKDTSQLEDFFCGVKAFDDFIHSDTFSQSVRNYFCTPYKVTMGKKIIAFFALSCSSLILDADSKDDYFSYDKFDIPAEYKEFLKGRNHYPAIEIAFFAVSEEYRGKQIGRSLLTKIESMAKEFDFAGCQFLTLDAYCTNEYSSAEFYYKCGFKMCDFQKPNSDTIPLFKPLL